MNRLAVRILIAGALCFGLLALGAWAYEKHTSAIRAQGFEQGAAHVQGKWDAAEKDRLAQEAITTAVNQAIATERHLAAQRATNEAIERERGLRAAAAVARAESERLSGELEATRIALATAPIEAVRLYAATATAVFDDCQRAYQGMAREADGHASDSLMYQRAWPE